MPMFRRTDCVPLPMVVCPVIAVVMGVKMPETC